MYVLRVLALVAVGLLAGIPLGAQGGIVVDGNQVLTGGSSCDPGQSLVGFAADGSAICACLPSLTQCSAACTDLSTDAANCGACENACGVDQQCRDGHCRECDVWEQDCSEVSEACYVNLSGDTTLCATPFTEEGAGQQGDACTFINGCAEGYGCVLQNDVTTPTGLECAHFCDLELTFPSDPDAFCAAEAGAGFRCVRASDFYSNVESDDVAFCVGPEWFS